MIKQIGIIIVLIVGAGIFGQYSFLKEKYNEYFSTGTVEQITKEDKPCPFKGMDGKYFAYTTGTYTAKGKFIKVECGGNTLMETPIGNLATYDSSKSINGFVLLDDVDVGTELSNARVALAKLQSQQDAMLKESQRAEELEKQLKDLTKNKK